MSTVPLRKLSLFIPSLNGGGAERVMVSLANGLVRRGIDTDLVLLKSRGVYRSQVDERVRVVDLNQRRTLTSLWALSRYLRREQPDALLSAMNYVNVVAVMARGLSGARTRLFLSEHAHLSRAMDDCGRLLAAGLPRAMKLSYRRADGVIAVSGGVADDLAVRLAYPRERITVCHNPIETLELIEKSREPLEHPWFAPGQPPVVIGVGRLSKEKDFPTLIAAFNRLRHDCAARLVILGQGPEAGTLAELVAQSPYSQDILLPGFQTNPYNWMRGAAVFALSSRREGFGNVLVEALACGTPVVSTDCPSGPAEILGHGQWGRLVPVGDAAAMARALKETLEAGQHADGTTRAADFSVDTALDGYLDVLSRQPA